MPQVILFSDVPLPYSHIGSYSTMYKNYFEQASHDIDVIICAKPAYFFEGVHYQLTDMRYFPLLWQRIIKQNQRHQLKAFEKVRQPNGQYILQVIDNKGLVIALHNYMVAKNIRHQCYIQYFYHGYLPGGDSKVYEIADEIILLTHSSYDQFKKQSGVLASRVSVLNNGIDTSKFHSIPAKDKLALKAKMNLAEKKIFLWCARDRPKKGLHLILDAWKKISRNHDDAALLLIGCEPGKPLKNVHYLGTIPNHELPQYYQMSDVYLFPTLCQEGFGMSLAEALHCGCYCIASEMGGVPEVLQYGKLGKLVTRPNFISDWVLAIEEFLSGNHANYEFSNDLYTADQWNAGMKAIISDAKTAMQ
jgi:glycosyltransferase involved in cell wall biosynthesis